MNTIENRLKVAKQIWAELHARLDIFASDQDNAPVLAQIQRYERKIEALEMTLAVRQEAAKMKQGIEQ